MMKLLTNGLGAYLTGDAIADAVLDYGMALANEHRVDLVDVPYLADHGRVGSVRLTVGWHAQVNAAENHDGGMELVDDAVLADLGTRTSALIPSGDEPMAAEDISYLARAEDY